MLQKGKKIGFEKIILWGVVAYVVYMIIKEMSKSKNGSDSAEVSGEVELATSSDGLPETKRLVSSGALKDEMKRYCCKDSQGGVYYVQQPASSTRYPCADGHKLCGK